MEEADADDATVGTMAFVLALRERGVRDTTILRAMEQVPRETFVPAHLRAHARRDIALPLSCGQTMTAPTMLAAMLSALDTRPGCDILEIGTGSGYATALLMRLGAGHVRSLERYATLAEAARNNLASLSLADAAVETADGLVPDRSHRYTRILVNGTLGALPAWLGEILAPGGRLVTGLATGEGARVLTVQRNGDDLKQTIGGPIRLDPMRTGRPRVL